MAEIFFSYVPADRPVVDQFGPTVALPGDKANLRLWQPGGEGRIADWLEHTTGQVYCIVSNAYLDLGGRDATVTALGDLCLIAPDRVTLVLTDPALAGLWGSRVRTIVLGKPARRPQLPLSVDELIALRAGASASQVESSLSVERPSPVSQSPSGWAMPDAARPRAPEEASPSGPRPRRGVTIGIAIGAIVAAAAAAATAALLGGAGSLAPPPFPSAPLPPATPGAIPVAPPPARRRHRSVEASAYAAASGSPGEDLLVQVLLHSPQQADATRDLAREYDPTARRRGVATLSAPVRHGQKVTVLLEGRDLRIEDAVQTIEWWGEATSLQFLVTLPARHGRSQVCARMMLDDVPVGSIRFVLEVAADIADITTQPRGDDARAHRRAFLSYATQDRAEVIKRAQGLRAAGLDFFQDIFSISPGEEWEPRLKTEIEICDLFLLFWSGSAAQSAWVQREVELALALHRAGDTAPDIIPVILEGPPPAQPIPNGLRHLQFSDYLSYAIASGTPLKPPAA